ncbi:hypothetical protein [Phenylobacterium sp.]
MPSLTFSMAFHWVALAVLIILLVGAGYLVWRLSERPKPGPRFDEFD